MPEEAKNKTAEPVTPGMPLIGAKLKTRRQALRLSLAQVELDTKIRGKFLTALEAGNYDKLPNDIYSRGFVQHYANHLGLDGPLIAAQYVAERGGVLAGDTKRPKLAQSKRIVFTGTILTLLGGAVLILGVVWYLLWQFSALAAPPRLTITSPGSDQAIAGGVIEVSGRTTPGSDISVNDSPVLADSDGGFSEKVALQDGVNAIRITSRSKLGKSTTVTRNVLATLPKLGVNAAVVPAAVFDGLALAISVKDTTSMVISRDGTEAWRGTVIAGWSMRFDAKDKISITTGNAGATSVTVTNKVVVGKKVDALGRDGEIRRNQEFTKDTVIP